MKQWKASEASTSTTMIPLVSKMLMTFVMAALPIFQSVRSLVAAQKTSFKDLTWFAKVIVQIVNSGIPVMISTHSPYFLQAVRYYSAMYSIEKYVNYYMAECGNDDMVSMKEVTNDLNQVFLTLAEPLNKIMNVDEVRGRLK